MTDDGFNVGVLYAGSRPAYPGGATAPKKTVDELEAEFAL